MALNIKPFYPLDHPPVTMGVKDLLDKISRPTPTAVYLKTELKKEETFNKNEDLYGTNYTIKWRQDAHSLEQRIIRQLDVI